MYNDIAIEIKNLSKMYKIYTDRKTKLLDTLNLKFLLPKNAYKEFWALRDVNLEIRKGEKIGLIGRNGAGKSTLLRIITGNITPTSGLVNVNGRISALLEMGTGFHPELSGKENVYLSLSYMGVTGKVASNKYEEIVEFSELDDFIDQPVKTYSAGMYTRLAFSVATSIEPEILIIDEILGAGDAYFAQKSIDRMKKITEGGTTVLFVSHDMYSVQRLCDKAIWIDRGKLIMESDTLSVSKSYSVSIREQEELRLTARNMKLQHKNVRSIHLEERTPILFHFVSDDLHPKNKHPISQINLILKDKIIERINVGDAMDNDENSNSFVLAGNDMDWGNPIKLDGKYIRYYENMNGKYAHAPFTFILFNNCYDDIKSDLKVEVLYKDISDEKIALEVFEKDSYRKIGTLDGINDGHWKSKAFSLFDAKLELCIDSTNKEESASSNTEEISSLIETNVNKVSDDTFKEDTAAEIKGHLSIKNRYGSGEIKITAFNIIDLLGKQNHVFTVGDMITMRIYYNAHIKVYNPIFVIAVYTLDGVSVSQFISNKDGHVINELNGKGYVDIILDNLLLGRGTYVCSVAIFKRFNLFEIAEPPAYDLHDRMYEFKIEQPDGINSELGLCVHPVKWEFH